MTPQMVEERATGDWTIRRVIAWATQDFRARGIESARLDAELLLAYALDTDRIRVILDSERRLLAGELAVYRELIKRRRSGEPIAYLLGRREFFGLPFRVDRRVLIPRPDTEALVEVALDRTRARSLFGRALDLCTGSGCVAIAFATRRPTWRVTGTDVSPEAVELARENALRLGAIWGVRFASGDGFAAVAAGERFELVTANPPYVPRAELELLEATIRDFEPRLALDGGSDGLSLIRRIVSETTARLVPGGVLALEVGAGQADGVARLLGDAGYLEVERRRDYGGHERVVSGRKS